MTIDIQITVFDRTSELYRFLRESNALASLELFSKTHQKDIPKGNTGYVLTVYGEVAGAASMYDEQDGGWLNELFEIVPKFRGIGLSRQFYRMVKEDLQADFIHGFATSDETQQLWEHLGQVCIDQDYRELIELCDGRTVEEYLKEERPELLEKWKELYTTPRKY